MLLDSPLLFAVVLIIGAVIVAFAVAALFARTQPATRFEEVPAVREEVRTPWVSGLAKTRAGLTARLLRTWRGPGELDSWLADVEEVLLSSDVGVSATRELLEHLRAQAGQLQSADSLRSVLASTLRDLLADAPAAGGEQPAAKPWVILVVGVNGVGKTTSIGKLAQRYREDGKKVLLVAADTFRAAAIEQLALWADRVGAEIVKHQQGGDPAAVVFDGIKAAQARDIDVVLIDTAGRLHVKANLMAELEKIARTIARQAPGAPHESLLVVDATSGQNALVQARVFHEAVRLTGVILAKLDGTAKGGMALAIRKELGLPIRYVGLGERPEDLAPFDPDEFVDALFTSAET